MMKRPIMKLTYVYYFITVHECLKKMTFSSRTAQYQCRRLILSYYDDVFEHVSSIRVLNPVQ